MTPEKIKEMLNDTGINQDELSKECGFSKPHINRLLNGRSRLTDHGRWVLIQGIKEICHKRGDSLRYHLQDKDS